MTKSIMTINTDNLITLIRIRQDNDFIHSEIIQPLLELKNSLLKDQPDPDQLHRLISIGHILGASDYCERLKIAKAQIKKQTLTRQENAALIKYTSDIVYSINQFLSSGNLKQTDSYTCEHKLLSHSN